MKVLVTSQRHSEQGVESHEMIHVGVGHKDMGNLEQVSREKGVDLPEIKEHGSSLKLKGDEKARVLKGRIHKPCSERHPCHGRLTSDASNR
jgi:hypothetical protein